MNKHLFLSFACMLLLASCSTTAQTVWHSHNPQTESRSILRGILFPKELSGNYHRLPERLKSGVRKEIYHLSTMNAGLSLRFHTNATQIRVRYTTVYGRSMHHMPLTGVSGIDLYTRRSEGSWLWCAPNYTLKDTIEYFYPKIDYKTTETNGREYELLLPLYNQVGWISVDVPEGAIFSFLPIGQDLPIVVYGSSIAQGACASRPGMAWTHIVSRKMNIPVINLGFSGNAFLEPEIIDLTIAVPSKLIVLDNLPNLAEKNSEKTHRLVLEAVERIRRKTDTPILLVDHIGYPYGEVCNEEKVRYKQVNKAQYEAFVILRGQGVPNIYYLSEQEMSLSNDAFVDGIHPSDLGMQQQAEAYIRVMCEILKKN